MSNRQQSAKSLSGLRSLAFEAGKGKLGSCYLAGPMTGLPDFNAPAFRKCAEMLRLCGWTVMSPVENDENDGIVLDGTTGQETFDYRRAMAWDLRQVCECDCVIVMPGWEYSRGALLEVYVALEVGTPVYTYLSQRRITELPKREVGFSSQPQPKPGSAEGGSALTERAGQGEGADRAVSSPTIVFPREGGAYLRVGDLSLPSDSAARKALPVATGVIDYFPDAIVAVAEVSRVGNDKHNPGEPLHWARGKSMDQADAIARHLIDRGKVDEETGLLHSAELAWRALANLQIELEEAGLAALPRGAREPDGD